MSIIYKISNIKTQKSYIGKTIYTLKRRWQEHINDSKKLDFLFYRAIRKYGTECWSLEVLEEISDINLLNDREIYWIDYYNTCNKNKGYNSALGGSGGIIGEEGNIKRKNKLKGKKKTIEHRKNNSLAQKKLYENGYINPRKNKHHTNEAKEKLRQHHLGLKASEESKQKMSMSRQKKWIIIPPEGESFNIINLQKFCKEKNLRPEDMPRKYGSNGWKAIKLLDG